VIRAQFFKVGGETRHEQASRSPPTSPRVFLLGPAASTGQRAYRTRARTDPRAYRPRAPIFERVADILPDPISRELFALWQRAPKALERQLAGLAG
jgi:hypothetical protein